MDAAEQCSSFKPTQRNVRDTLGRNAIRYHNRIYDLLGQKRGSHTKICAYGTKKGDKYGIKHDGDSELSIRNFSLRGTSLGENGELHIQGSGDGLQGFCKDCETKRRHARMQYHRQMFRTMTDDAIRNWYRERYRCTTKCCSRCKTDLEVGQFSISRGMETGLHNQCQRCVRLISSSVGDRDIIYMPDAPHVRVAKHHHSTDLHDDHIMPLSLGGSNDLINHQLLHSAENIHKSNKLDHFSCVRDIDPMLLSERYRRVLEDASDLKDLESRLTYTVHQDIMTRYQMNDRDLATLYREYFHTYNLRRCPERAVKKLREFVEARGWVGSLECEQVQGLVHDTEQLVANVQEIAGQSLLLQFAQKHGELPERLNDSSFGNIGQSDDLAVVRFAETQTTTAVHAHVHLHKLVNEFEHFGEQFVGRFVTTVTSGLPVERLDLDLDSEEAVNNVRQTIGGHDLLS